LTEGPVVLVFYYGYTCNHCVSQLFGLSKDIEKFRELGAQVVAVSADPLELTRERYEKYGAFAFPVLSDQGNAVAQKYGTFIPSPKKGEDGDLAHGTFVISRQGKIVWANRGDGPFTENRTLLVEVHRCERSSRAP
jgi:peroxiredoxin